MDYLVSFLLCILPSWLLIKLLLPRLTSPKFNLPPGPKPLPIVGNLFELGTKPHKSLAELAKRHGPIICLQLGSLRTVVISSKSVAKEVLQKRDASFCNRTVPDSLTVIQHDEFSQVWLPVAPQWRSLRKIGNLQIFSAARLDQSQHLRRKKLGDLVRHVERCCESGISVDIGEMAFNTTINLLSNTFFSVDLVDPSSKSSREMKETIWQVMVEAGKPNFSDYFPILKKWDPQGIRKRLEIHAGKMVDIFNDMIQKRLAEKEGGGLDDKCDDALDSLLKISKENSGELTLPHITHLLLDMFAAGSDTTSSTVEWAMAELLHSPDKLKKAKQELEQVVGKGNPVREEDFINLPYLQSVIKETFRLHPPTPFLIPRKTDTDVELCGFTVPKDSQVLVNVWAIGRESSLWENPGSFEPERFLGSDIDVKGRDFELIPFGSGRRICPGLPLAVRMLPLMLGTLVSCFDWKVEGGSIDMDDKFGLTLAKAEPMRAVPVSVARQNTEDRSSNIKVLYETVSPGLTNSEDNIRV